MLVALKFWWLAPITVLAIVAGYYRISRDHAREQLVQARSLLATVSQVATEQKRHDQAIIEQREKDNANIAAELADLNQAHALLSAALADRVRQYEALGRACRVPAKPPAASGHPDAPAVAGRAGPIGDALADLIPACRADADELAACQRWAQSVTCR